VNYPKYLDSIIGGSFARSIELEEKGHYWLYGFLESQEGDTVKTYAHFEKSFWVR